MELLAPAGNFEKLKTAVHYGADGVYFAGKSLGLRAFAGNFSDEEIIGAMAYLHSKGKVGYVTLNIVAKDSDFEDIDNYLSLLVKAKVDGVCKLIMAAVIFGKLGAVSLFCNSSIDAFLADKCIVGRFPAGVTVKHDGLNLRIHAA